VEQILGYHPEEIVGKMHFYDFFVPESREAMKNAAFEVIGRRETFRAFPNLNVRKDGSIVAMETTGLPVYDPSGAFIGYRGADRDVTERQRAEEVRRNSERRFRLFFDNSLDAVLMTNTDGSVYAANPAARAMFGMSEEEICRVGRAGLVVDDERLRAALETRRLTGRVQTELTHVRKDGTTFDGDFSSAVAGEEGAAFVIIRDISERKRTAEALRESEQRLRLATEAAKIGLFDWNIQTGVNVWTPKLEEMYGLARGEFGRTQPAWEQLIHAADRAGALAAVEKTLATGEPVEHEWRVVWRDGSVHWIAGWFQALKDVTGKPLRMTGVNIDITARKAAEEALRESEQRFRTMADTAPVMIWMSGRDKECTFFNKPWLDFTGRTIEQELGDGWTAGLHPDDADRCMETYTSSFDARRSFEVVYRLRRADGEYRWILDTGVPRYQGGEFEGFIGSCLDITERKQAEEALRKSEQQLRALAGSLMTAQEDERRRIARELHDDVTQKLAFLSIEIGRLAAACPLPEQEARASLHAIQSQALHMSDDVRRLSHGLHPSVIEDFGLSTALEEFCEEFGNAERLTVTFKSSADCAGFSPAVASCLYRIGQEALRNAARHAGASGVHVELTVRGGRLQLEVRDNGAGFSAEATAVSNGLGLISMKERIRSVNGELSITSRPGRGTVVLASVPLSGVGYETASNSIGR
jgi:PAS domain S-box-containing protein